MKASRHNRQWTAPCAWAAGAVLFAVIAAVILPAGVQAATLVGSPFILGYDGWTDTFTGFPASSLGTHAWYEPAYGILIANQTLIEASDGRMADGGSRGDAGGTPGDGLYTPLVMVNSVTTPATYDLTARLSTTDNDGIGVVFGYQDNDNYFRVGLREEVNTDYGFGQGLSIQKVVGGVITQLYAPDASTIYDHATNTPFNLKMSVSGTSYNVYYDDIFVTGGSDPNLQAGKYGIMSWGIKQHSNTDDDQWGMQLHSMTLESATVNKTHSFGSETWPVKWKTMLMYNSSGQTGAEGDDSGNFRFDFRDGTIQDDSNSYTNATTMTTPGNVDFTGATILVDDPGAEALTNYEMRVRMANRDNDGIGLIVRAKQNMYGSYDFYRINFSQEALGTGTWRAPLGMSVQKCVTGLVGTTWTELFRDDQAEPLFLFTNKTATADAIPFDVKVVVDGSTITVQVINDPDGTHTVIDYPLITDSDNPILNGTIGFTNWGSGDQGNGTIYSGWGGNIDSPLLVEIGTFPEPDKPGDANKDGKVDKADAALLAANWLKASGAVWGEGDFNEDGAVDGLDLAILAANWSPGGGTAVPEPGTLALLLTAAASLVVLLRRK